MLQGRLAEANNQARLALSLAESMEDIVYAGESLTILAQCAVMRGEEAAAREHLDALDAAAKASANPVVEGYAAALKALINLTHVRDNQARQLLAQTLPAVSFFPKGMYATWMADVLTDAALEADEPDEARAHASTANRFAEDADNDWARARAQLAAARVNAHVGEIQAARQDVHHALERAGHNDDLMTTIEALELLARLDHQIQSPDIAVRLAAAAAAARAHTEYVRPLTGAASMNSLRTKLTDSAYDQAWSEGAVLPLDETVALARRRRGQRRRPTTGWDALTPAEHRVVTLVSEG